MLVSLKWLREYVDIPRDVDVDDLAHRLTMASAEVEGIQRIGGDWDPDLVRVAEIVDVLPHPGADRLRLAVVDWGGSEPQTVICGAPNLEQGQRVAFGREGATLIDPRSGTPTELKRATIRGVESAGMVLSERELGLSDEHEGIIELPGDAPVGSALVDYLGDVVLDVHIWPNRPDMMCMVGIAREVAAILGADVRVPSLEYAETGPPLAELGELVRVEIPDLCRRFVATVIEDVTVGPSPGWMQERLIAAGMRPINNVVDITNYVMLEVGQPLHAFDLDQLQGPIVVRSGRDGESLTTLDDVDRPISPDMMLITDDRGPIGLAGVMGGESTEVSDGTTRVLLEGAWWDPVSIRRTSTRLALRSEASSRFERGLALGSSEAGVRRATKLFVEHCGGVARTGMIDTQPAPSQASPVSIDRQRLDTLIGFEVPTDEVVRHFEALGMSCSVEAIDAGERFTAQPPWWRTDLVIADDLAEEIVRLAGYDRLPDHGISGRVPVWEPRPGQQLRDRLRAAFVDAGLQEVITYSLTTTEVLARVLPEAELAAHPPLRLRNALSSDRQVMRPTLRHSLLEVVERNARVGATEIAVFEVARVYRTVGEAGRLLPDEHDQLCAALSGAERDRWGRPTDRQLDFYDGKGVLAAALGPLGVDVQLTALDEFGFEPGRVARLESSSGAAFGVLGEVAQGVLDAFDIAQAVTLIEIDVPALLEVMPPRAAAAAPPRFPSVDQDLALVVDEAVSAGDLQSLIEASPLVAQAVPFDVYRGGQLNEGQKSVAFSISYQAPDRTLTSEDANREQGRILRRLQHQLGAQPRQ